MRSETYYRRKAETLKRCGLLVSADACKAIARKVRRNNRRSLQNEMLRELCGTSAAAARRDMGL